MGGFFIYRGNKMTDSEQLKILVEQLEELQLQNKKLFISFTNNKTEIIGLTEKIDQLKSKMLTKEMSKVIDEDVDRKKDIERFKKVSQDILKNV